MSEIVHQQCIAPFVIDRLYQTVRRARSITISSHTNLFGLHEVIVVEAVPTASPLANDTLVSMPSGLGQGSTYFSTWIENKGKHLVFQGANQRRDHGDIADDRVAEVVINWVKAVEKKNGDLK